MKIRKFHRDLEMQIQPLKQIQNEFRLQFLSKSFGFYCDCWVYGAKFVIHRLVDANQKAGKVEVRGKNKVKRNRRIIEDRK